MIKNNLKAFVRGFSSIFSRMGFTVPRGKNEKYTDQDWARVNQYISRALKKMKEKNVRN